MWYIRLGIKKHYIITDQIWKREQITALSVDKKTKKHTVDWEGFDETFRARILQKDVC